MWTLYVDMISSAFRIALLFMPFLLPIIGAILAWNIFKHYAADKFDAKNKKILLELKLPREIKRSPLAMELVLTGLYNTSRESTWIDRNIKGQSRVQYSLEIASFGGDIHFYIRTEEGSKDFVEAQIYSQYPTVEVHQVPDYTHGVEFVPGVVDIHATEFVKEKASAMPIKTYVDYGLDRDDEEYFKIDPMTPMLEVMGALKPNEQMWFQLIIKAHKKEQYVHKDGKREKVDWVHEAKLEKEKLLKEIAKPLEKDDTNKHIVRHPTKGEGDMVAALERNIAKIPFDVGIRVLYIAPKADFRGMMKGGVMGAVRQYNALNLNSFKPDHTTGFDYPWQDFREIRLNAHKKKMLKYFKERSYWDIKKLSLLGGLKERKSVVMSTEELATMFHLPGEVATTPTFSRLMSRKAEAPTNLPI